MSYDFKPISQVETVDGLNANTNYLIEQDGQIKRVSLENAVVRDEVEVHGITKVYETANEQNLKYVLIDPAEIIDYVSLWEDSHPFGDAEYFVKQSTFDYIRGLIESDVPIRLNIKDDVSGPYTQKVLAIYEESPWGDDIILDVVSKNICSFYFTPYQTIDDVIDYCGSTRDFTTPDKFAEYMNKLGSDCCLNGPSFNNVQFKDYKVSHYRFIGYPTSLWNDIYKVSAVYARNMLTVEGLPRIACFSIVNERSDDDMIVGFHRTGDSRQVDGVYIFNYKTGETSVFTPTKHMPSLDGYYYQDILDEQAAAQGIALASEAFPHETAWGYGKIASFIRRGRQDEIPADILAKYEAGEIAPKRNVAADEDNPVAPMDMPVFGPEITPSDTEPAYTDDPEPAEVIRM